jgi:hypothetical protein
MAEDNDILMPANVNILSRISKNAKVFIILIQGFHTVAGFVKAST